MGDTASLTVTILTPKPLQVGQEDLLQRVGQLRGAGPGGWDRVYAEGDRAYVQLSEEHHLEDFAYLRGVEPHILCM